MAKASWSKWTPEVLESFKIDYQKEPWNVLLEKYPFTKASMIAKASELKIRRNVEKHPAYSTEDDSLIRRMFYNNHSDEEIAEALHRTVSGIKTRRGRLGLLVRPGRWTADEESILLKFYNKIPASEVSEMISGRSRDAVVTHALSLGLTGYRPYHEYTDLDDLFIREHYLNMSDDEIAEELHHPRESIKNRRNKLGLHRPVGKTKYEDATSYFRKFNSEWKNNSMISCGYKCAVTGNRFDDIHHLYALNSIVHDACESNGFDISNFDLNSSSHDEKMHFIQMVKEEQNKHPLGVCLCKSVHSQFHTIYGYGNNTPEQFYEFVNKYYPNCTNL